MTVDAAIKVGIMTRALHTEYANPFRAHVPPQVGSLGHAKRLGRKSSASDMCLFSGVDSGSVITSDTQM